MCLSKSIRSFLAFVAVVCILPSGAVAGGPSVTAITYQGQLKKAGVPTNAMCDFEFSLWDGDNDPDPGTQIESTIPLTTEVSNGLFQVELDFGSSAFEGAARWLQIDVCCASPCAPAFASLAPRQSVSAAPYAIHTRGIHVDEAGSVGIGTTSPAQTLDVRGQLQVQDSIRLDAQDAPMIVRQWNPMTSGHRAGFGRWGMFMESDMLFVGIPGSDVENAVSLRFGGWLADSTRQDWLTINKNGDVGIGTANPAARLDVTGPIRSSSASGGSVTVLNPTNQLASASLSWQGDVARIRVGGDGDGAHASFDIQTTTNRSLMRLLHNGNVGIGTTQPDAQLEVTDAIRVSRPGVPAQYLEIASPGSQGLFLTGRTNEDNKKPLVIQNVHSGGGSPAGSSDIVFRTGVESAPTTELM